MAANEMINREILDDKKDDKDADINIAIDKALVCISDEYILYDQRKYIAELLRYMKKTDNDAVRKPYSLLVVCDDFDRSAALCRCMSRAVEMEFGIANGFAAADMDEWSQLLTALHMDVSKDVFENINRYLQQTDYKIKGIVFYNITKESFDGGIGRQIVHSLQADSVPELVRIFCVNSDVVQRFGDDHTDVVIRQFGECFPEDRRLVLGNATANAVCEQILERFRFEEAAADKGFEQALREYISAVYPKVECGANEFALDMYNYISGSYKQRTKPEKGKNPESDGKKIVKLQRGDIPYYELDTGYDQFKIPVLKSYDLESGKSAEDAAVIIVPSLYYARRKNAGSYTYDKEIQGKELSYNGIQTNDAPLQYLMNRVYMDGDRLKRVICISSKEVRIQKAADIGDATTYDRMEALAKYYNRLICPDKTKDKNCTDRGRGELEVSAIAIDYDGHEVEKLKREYDDMYTEFWKSGNTIDPRQWTDKEHSFFSAIEKPLGTRFPQIFDELERQLEGCSKVYIDFTGGQRDVNFLMVEIIRFLQAKGVICENLIYSNINNGKDCLVDMEIHYKMFQLINATNEFLNTGSANQMRVFFDQVKSGKGIEPVRKIVALLHQFSDMINVCNLEYFDITIQNLVNEIENFTKEDNDSLYCQMFKSVIPTIKEKLYIDKVIETRGEKKFVNYPYIIMWCLDNNMFQQALTLYVELMPKYYSENKIIPESLFKVENKNYADAFYTGIWKNLMKNDSAIQKVNEFKRTVAIGTRSFASVDKLRSYLKSELGEIPYETMKGEKVEDIVLDKLTKGITICNNKDLKIFDENVKILQLKNTEEGMFKYIYNIGTGSGGREDTYLVKLQVIENVRTGRYENNGITSKNLYLHDIMLYYLVAKIMRNQMNHAAGSEDGIGVEGWQKTIEYCSEYWHDEDVMESLSISDLIEQHQVERALDLLRRAINMVINRSDEIEFRTETERTVDNVPDADGCWPPDIKVISSSNSAAKDYVFISSSNTDNGKRKREGNIREKKIRDNRTILDGKKYKAIMPYYYLDDVAQADDNDKMIVRIKRVEGDHFMVYKK